MKNAILLLLAVSFGWSAHADQAPETVELKIKAVLNKVVPNPAVPGTVTLTPAPGSGSETVKVTLSDCQSSVGNAKMCTGTWSKTLTIDGVKMSFFILVFNSSASSRHAATLSVCFTGAEEISNCNRLMTTEIDIMGTQFPHVELYNNKYDLNPSYQPILAIGDLLPWP